jgi:hypothetical protein
MATAFRFRQLRFSKATKMSVCSTFRDFADGLSRGLSMYFTQRNDHIVLVTCMTCPPGSEGVDRDARHLTEQDDRRQKS